MSILIRPSGLSLRTGAGAANFPWLLSRKKKKNRSKELISYSIPLLLIAYTLQLGIVFLAYKLTQAKVN